MGAAARSLSRQVYEMKTISLFVEGNSAVHRLDPLTKLLYAVGVSAIVYIAPGYAASAAALAFSFMLLSFGRAAKRIIPIAGVSLTLMASILIIQGFFHPSGQTPLWKIAGFTLYKEGLQHAILLCMRILNMIFAFGVLVLTTRPDDLARELVRKGLSPKIGYILGSVMQIVPQMKASLSVILDAQRARGLETEGRLWTRAQAFIPLLGPVVIHSLVSTRERAIALEARGFNRSGKRTFLREPISSPMGLPLRVLILASLVLAITWRVHLCLSL